VLTVAVSLASGAASLASVFPSLRPHLLAMSLAGLVVIAAVNLWGIAESARVLMLPMVAFLSAIFGVIVVGLVRSHPAALVGTAQPVHVTEALGVILILKAFAAGCSALTGIEAIANGVPAFRQPRARRAQRTELMLGVLLGVLLIGLSVLIRREHVTPRGGVTVLAQLTAGSFGTGWAYYAASIAVTLVLGLAANTSFGGLPVLMSLLSDDNRLPHLFGLRAERPVHRHGVVDRKLLPRGRNRTRPRPDPAPPAAARSLVIVPVGSINKLTEHALHATLSLSDDVIAVTVHVTAVARPGSWPATSIRYRLSQPRHAIASVMGSNDRDDRPMRMSSSGSPG
jgi:Amino acid permease